MGAPMGSLTGWEWRWWGLTQLHRRWVQWFDDPSFDEAKVERTLGVDFGVVPAPARPVGAMVAFGDVKVDGVRCIGLAT